MGACMSSSNQKRSRNTRNRGKRRNDKRRRRDRDSSSSRSESSMSESDSYSDSESKDPSQPVEPTPVQVSTRNNAESNYPPVPQEDLDILFYQAHTVYHFLNIAVSHDIIRTAMKLALLAPTAYNCCPMRVIFVTNENTEAKEKLLSTVFEANLEATRNAPLTAIVCTDDKYTHHLPKLMPYVPNAQQMFEQYEDLNEMIKIRNANLQGGYLILAFRSLGLACGPMSGFDNAKCDELFLERQPSWKTNFLINIGYADPEKLKERQRAYRLPFEVAAKLIQ